MLMETEGAELAVYNGGAIRIDDTLPPGPVTLKVELAGFRPALVAVLVPRGLTVPVRVHLQPAKE